MALPTDDLVPLNAIAGLLDAFEQTPLVALGERHSIQELADFLMDAPIYEQFFRTVRAINRLTSA